MSGVKMHRRGLGRAAALGAVAIFALVLSAQTASAALLTLDDVTLPGDPIQIVNGVNDGDTASGPPPTNEGVANAIDNTTNKYLNFLDYGSGFVVTPRLPSVVKAIRLYSANDAPARDPASFILEGAQSPGGPFTLIYGQNVQLGPRNPVTTPPTPIDPNVHNFVTVSFPNTATYSSYRVTFPTLSNAGSDVGMQIAEVELLGTLIPEPTALGLLAVGAIGLLRRRRA